MDFNLDFLLDFDFNIDIKKICGVCPLELLKIILEIHEKEDFNGNN